MKLLIIVILLVIGGVATGFAQLGEEHITIIVTSEGKAKISQTLFPETFVSTIDVHIISEKISKLLAIDEKDILLGTTQNQDLLKIATLGASAVDLKYNADILTYESGVFKLKYSSDRESRVSLPPLSKLVSLNTIPIEITDEYVLPPGDISLSYTIRPVTSKEFFVTVGDSEQKVETITAAKIEEFSANADEIQFIIKDRAIVLTIIPKAVMVNPNDAFLNGEEVDFSQFHQNATHSWIRIDPHEKGLVKILDTSEKPNEGGGCLIATATYGSEMAPQVQFLREIRDNQLMNTNSGVSFMTGFNQLYYSFSPYIADLERENPLFQEAVRAIITPMLVSLSIMTFAESEDEILGYGIGVILLNIGMYFVLPFLICYYVRRCIRTTRMRKENKSVILNFNVLSVVKSGLFGLVVLLVISVSASTAFVESAYADGHESIATVLDITHQNIIDSINDSAVLDDAQKAALLLDVGAEYEKALADITGDDIDVVAAKESALLAMESFEVIAEDIGALEEQVSTLLPPGLGAGIDSASDEGIAQGQGLGVGGIPPGVLKQIQAANTFEVIEGIENIENEAEEYRNLIKLNNLDGVEFQPFEESVNLAKELLAAGVVPDAQVQLIRANQIIDELVEQIAAESEDQSEEDIREMLGDQENLGLTKKDIKDLEEMLEDFTAEESDAPGNSGGAPGQNNDGDESPGNSGSAPGQDGENDPGNSGNAQGNNGDESPGNSGSAPGQNKGNEDAELPPGEGAAGDNPSQNAIDNENAVGLGLGSEGKVPPGLAKLFGYPDGTGEDANFVAPEDFAPVPPGFGAAVGSASDVASGQGVGLGGIPPGLYIAFNDKPDDFFENHFEGSAEGDFKGNWDGTNRGHADGKGKFGAHPGKNLSDAPKSKAVGNDKGGNPNCNDEGITDGDSENIDGEVGVDYIVQGFTAIGSSCKDATDQMIINVNGPSSPPPFAINVVQPYTFQPDEAGTWTIMVNAQGQFGTRTITVTSSNVPPTISATATSPINENTSTLLDGTATDPDGDDLLMTYSWVKTSGIGGSIDNADQLDATFNAPNIGGPGADRDYVFTLTVTDEGGAESTTTVNITVVNSG